MESFLHDTGKPGEDDGFRLAAARAKVKVEKADTGEGGRDAPERRSRPINP